MTAGDTGNTPGKAALALASVRITRGNPSLDEVAALATVLAARARVHAQDASHRTGPSGPDGAGAAARTPWEHPVGPFRAPGAWAS
ncbi:MULTISPECIES: acyl-CoA carboxylase epsilon subunit [unclassified Streptomyces]|uniref:acyl-CoA carboxylase epsilon subunit n=1 Tax=unclassified Streptomyces TaxID=2593676 RepID=UPI0035D934B1